MSSQPTTPRASRPQWWQWPTVLSLDAPVIVVVWQTAAAQVAGLTLGWPERFVLGASVWLAYTIDRWIEAGRLDHATVSTSRHRFHKQWRTAVAIVAALVLAADVAVALARLSTTDVVLGTIVAAAAATYVLSHQWLHRHAPWRVPKEVCVAVLLPAGIWLFVRDGQGPALWTTLGLFALLCLTNTALISLWEAEVDRRHGQSSLALKYPTAAGRIRLLPWLVLAMAVLAAIGIRGAALPALAAAGSAMALAIIDAAEPRIHSHVARVLSDVALLTPLVVMVAS